MKIEGVYTAIVTPFRQGEIDEEAFRTLLQRQIAAGVNGVVPCGTTGESITLSLKEHLRVVEIAVEECGDKIPVIAGAGSACTHEAIELAKECHQRGANGLLQVTPYYNRPTQEGIYQHFLHVAKATPLPVVLYNVPGRTSSHLLPETIERLAELPQVVAVKEASGDLETGTEIVARCGDRVALLSGDDFTAFPLYTIGSRGVISVTSNVMPNLCTTMWQAVTSNDWATARSEHFRLQALTQLLFEESNPTPSKAALELLGLCTSEVRLPLIECSPTLKEKIKTLLAREELL